MEPTFSPTERDKLNILQITSHFPPHFIGGDALYCYQISKSLAIMGHKVSVIYDKTSYDICSRKKKSNLEQIENIPNLAVLPVQPRHLGELFSLSGACFFFNPNFFSNLKRLAGSKGKFDLLHLHNISWIGFTSFLVPELAEMPTVYTAHDYWLMCPKSDLTNKKGVFCQGNDNCVLCVPPSLSFRATVQQRSRIYHRLLKKINRVICVSEFQESIFSKHFPNVKFEVLHNFVDTKKIKALNEISYEAVVYFEKAYRISNKDKVVLFVGKTVASKGFFVLLRSFAEISKSVPNCVLCAVGQCENFAEIAIAAKNLGIDKQLRLLGKVNEDTLLVAYKRADLLVLPSIWPEPCPLVLLEGMAAKKPIVSSRIGGIPEIVRNGENGFLVTPNDVNNLADSIFELLSSPDKSLAMGAKGCEMLHNKFSVEAHIQKLLEIYNKSIDG
ncbi:MAG: glycosyltransferase family 4 protein [Candidatus Bathyarchaeia archaeon]|jgi:glycosyltransferase involved in cell wall biosynthesis